MNTGNTTNTNLDASDPNWTPGTPVQIGPSFAKIRVVHTAPDGTKLEHPVKELMCDEAGCPQSIMCWDGHSYDGYVFTPDRTDLNLVFS